MVFYIFITVVSLGITLMALVQLCLKPSNNREWSEDQAILPYSLRQNNLVTIHNIRDFRYISASEFTKNYYNKTFDLEKIKGAYYCLSPFPGFPGSAHAFLSFEFEGGDFLDVSVEIRKRKGQRYDPIKGLFNQYEIMYVIADERDIIKLRTDCRKDPVYIYPLALEKKDKRRLFEEILLAANHLKEKPEFYNTITNTCTTHIATHLNRVIPKALPFLDPRVLLPKNSDYLAYKRGLIDTKLTFKEIREKFLVNERAKKYADSPNFSLKIREIS